VNIIILFVSIYKILNQYKHILILIIIKMFRKIIPLLKPIHNKRLFSCNASDLTSKLRRQEQNLDTINKNIGRLSIMSILNIMVSLIF
jgi:hypothetical protein